MLQISRTIFSYSRLAALGLLTVVSMLSGCTEGLLKNPAETATVYIFRSPGAMPGAYPTPILIDGKLVGNLVRNGYFKVRLKVGPHTISSPAKNKPELSIYAAKGLTYYVSQEVITGHPPFVLINRVKESIGQAYVDHGRRIY